MKPEMTTMRRSAHTIIMIMIMSVLVGLARCQLQAPAWNSLKFGTLRSEQSRHSCACHRLACMYVCNIYIYIVLLNYSRTKGGPRVCYMYVCVCVCVCVCVFVCVN
jgi:hypothetical protein